MWLSHANITRIQLVNEEWFKVPHESKTGNILPAILTPLANTTQDSGPTSSPSPTKDYPTSDKYSSRSEEIPFTLSCAIAAQALTEESGAPLNSPAALVTVPPEGSVDQGKESPTTSILSSPGAATHAAAPPPAAEEDQSPSALECTGLASLIPLAAFPPLPPADPAPPPAPKQSPQPAPKQPSRPKNKGTRSSGKQ